MPPAIGPRCLPVPLASLLQELEEVVQLDHEERLHTSVGTRQDVADLVGNCMYVAIGGQSPRSSLVVTASVAVHLPLG